MSLKFKVVEAGEIWNDLANYSDILSEGEELRKQIELKIETWQVDTAKALLTDYPYADYEDELTEWCSLPNDEKYTAPTLKSSVNKYMRLCEEVGQPKNESYWQSIYSPSKKVEKANENTPLKATVSANHLQQEWQKTLDMARIKWESEYIQTQRMKFVEVLAQLLNLFAELRDALESLGLEPGILFDLSTGKLAAREIEEFKRWSKYLAEDENVRLLCDLMGKMRQIETSERIERATVAQIIETPKPDVNSKEEIVGVRLGRELEYVLPSQLALLSEPETEVLFDLKYVESQLMCFDLQGIVTSKETVDVEQDVSIQEEDTLGPMIICVDTSGSMAGAPETVAKAVTLYMASRAREQGRACYLINFSTQIVTLDLVDAFDLGTLIDFLKMSFHGGTDVAPALEHSLVILEKDSYENADVLIISDFIMTALPELTANNIEEQRTRGSHFNSLVIGNCFRTESLRNIFDHEWIFDPVTSRVHELVGFQKRIAENTIRD